MQELLNGHDMLIGVMLGAVGTSLVVFVVAAISAALAKTSAPPPPPGPWMAQAPMIEEIVRKAQCPTNP